MLILGHNYIFAVREVAAGEKEFDAVAEKRASFLVAGVAPVSIWLGGVICDRIQNVDWIYVGDIQFLHQLDSQLIMLARITDILSIRNQQNEKSATLCLSNIAQLSQVFS